MIAGISTQRPGARLGFLQTQSGPRSPILLCVLFACALVCLLSPGAHAASLRCDKALLQEGAHMYEVSQLCGAPVAEFSRLEFLHPDVAVYVDEWVYRLGTNKFERLLRFENGRLRSIRTLRKPQSSEGAISSGRSTPRDTGTVHRISW